MTVQNKGELNVIKEDAYVVLPTTEDEVVFALSIEEDEPEDPKILYDNGDHALFFHSPKNVVILDFLHEDVQRKLEFLDRAFVVEIDYKIKKLQRNYEVPVEIVSAYPFDITKYIA